MERMTPVAPFMLVSRSGDEMAARAAEIFAMRERGEATVPTTIGAEKAFNPFLRAGDADAFAAVRAAKDVF
jgi:hydroxyacylglutathione hydrolase